MILVHKLKGEALWINADLVSFVESNHDTVLTLHDGRHVVVAESPVEVADALQLYRAATLASGLPPPRRRRRGAGVAPRDRTRRRR